nr:hypothetical protein EUX21_01495 [synthetic Caulobacter sp. 'ethensis']
MSERRGNPFGLFLLGFVVGVLATFGTILFLTSSGGGYEDGPAETRTAADDAAAAAMAAKATQPAPPKAEAVAPPPEVPANPSEQYVFIFSQLRMALCIIAA